MHCVSLLGVNLEFHMCRGNHGARLSSQTAKNCPLVWDTGASFVTPFRSDFIDYVECRIPVNDMAQTNSMIGIGTNLHCCQLDGQPFFFPCLFYHLPSAKIQLFGPQTYHTIYDGHSSVNGDCVKMHVDIHKVIILIQSVHVVEVEESNGLPWIK